MKKLFHFAIAGALVAPTFSAVISRPAEAAWCDRMSMNPRCGYTREGAAGSRGSVRGRCPVGTCAKNGTAFFTVSAANCSKANCHRH